MASTGAIWAIRVRSGWLLGRLRVAFMVDVDTRVTCVQRVDLALAASALLIYLQWPDTAPSVSIRGRRQAPLGNAPF